MNAFNQYEVWFVTGAQLLYGGDAVIAVDAPVSYTHLTLPTILRV